MKEFMILKIKTIKDHRIPETFKEVAFGFVLVYEEDQEGM